VGGENKREQRSHGRTCDGSQGDRRREGNGQGLVDGGQYGLAM